MAAVSGVRKSVIRLLRGRPGVLVMRYLQTTSRDESPASLHSATNESASTSGSGRGLNVKLAAASAASALVVGYVAYKTLSIDTKTSFHTATALVSAAKVRLPATTGLRSCHEIKAPPPYTVLPMRVRVRVGVGVV